MKSVQASGWILSGIAVATGCIGFEHVPKVDHASAFLSVSNGPREAAWTRNFNPLLPTALFPSAGGIYEPLLVYNRVKGNYVPWLATSYTWSADNTKLTFAIRSGVKWSDGRPFTARDVAFTFELLRRQKALDSRAVWDFLSEVQAIDDSTFELSFRRAYTPGLVLVGHQVIVPEHIFRNVKDVSTFANENPVATGPFTVVKRFEPGVYELGRNEAYWQPGKPAIAGLRVPAFSSNQAATRALVAGELDWAGLFVADVDDTFVARDRAHNGYWFPLVGNPVVLYANTRRKPLGDVSVRKALSMALDRPRIVREAMHGYTVPSDATGLADTDGRWKDPKAIAAGTWTTRNLERANAQLDAAGLKRGPDGARRGPGGATLHLGIEVVAGWSDWESAARVIADNLKEVGIAATVSSSEYGAYLEKAMRGDFDLCVGSSLRGPTPYHFYRGLMGSGGAAPLGERAHENYGRFASREVDETLRKFEGTTDAATRVSLNQRLQSLFVENAPALPLFPGPSWGEYTTTRFTGFPDETNPYAKLAPHDDPEPLLVMLELKPRLDSR
jgi:peptide/nickel transport system substrate-binding protein